MRNKTFNAQIHILSGVCDIGPFYRAEIAYCIREHLACVKTERLYLGKRPRKCNQVLNSLCFWRLLALSI